MRGTLKAMPPILSCCPTTLEAEARDMTVNAEPSCLKYVSSVAVWQIAAEEQSRKMAFDMEVRMKQRCVTEFLHAKGKAPNDIQWHLVNMYGDQTVDVSTVRRWVVCFSSGNSDVRDRPHSGSPGTSYWAECKIQSCSRWVPHIPVWRSWSKFQSLAGLSYHSHSPDLAPDYMGNIFLTMKPSRKWFAFAVVYFYESNMTIQS
jgi:hypothetical protein